MAASIEKYTTKNGVRYMVRYRKPDGTQTKKRGFKRKIDAVNWAADHVTIAKAEGRYIDPQKGKITLGKLYGIWFSAKKPMLKASTIERIESTWNYHYAQRWADYRLTDVTREDIQQWVGELTTRVGSARVWSIFEIMRALFDLAVMDKRISTSPCKEIELPRRPSRKERRIYLTARQLLEFGDACVNLKNQGTDRRALVLMLGFCGLRWGEAAGLRVRDVDLENGLIHVVHNIVWTGGRPVEGTPKSYEQRYVPMPKVVIGALAPICAKRDGRDDLVFVSPRGNPIQHQTISTKSKNLKWWASALKRMGWPESAWPVPHDLRHTAASLAVHAGANVKALQRMLGHKNASMTLDVYADLFDSDLIEIAKQLDRTVLRDAIGTAGSNRAQNVPTTSSIEVRNTEDDTEGEQ